MVPRRHRHLLHRHTWHLYLKDIRRDEAKAVHHREKDLLPGPRMSEKPSIDKARDIYQRKDEEHWAELQNIVADGKLELSDILINFPAFVRRREIPRLLA